MTANEYVFTSIRDLGRLIRSREASPVELAAVFLDRLEKLGPDYNAVVTVTRHLALSQAALAEEEIADGRYRGPLHGIPYGAKDLLATSGGIPTSWGAAPLRDQTFELRCDGSGKSERGGRGAGRETGHGGASGRRGLPPASRVVHRAGHHPLGQGQVERRLLQRLRRGHRRRPGALRHRLRDGRVDHLARQQLRRRGAAPHLRAREPLRRDGALLHAGQARSALPHGGRLRPRAGSDSGQRPERPLHYGQAVQLRRFGRVGPPVQARRRQGRRGQRGRTHARQFRERA